MNSLIDFGKYSGESYEKILATDIKYCRWLSTQPMISEEIKKILLEQLPKDEGYVMTFGKYKNKPLNWIKEYDIKYIEYLLKSQFVNDKMPKLLKELSS